MDYLSKTDPAVAAIVQAELERQRNCIELIASENFTSLAVMEAAGSVLTNKYAEGYPHKRYYGGCQRVDEVEDLARDRACELFKCKYANVQPHSGSQANFAAITAVLDPGEKIMGMSLDHGGHLTHGSKVNFSGRFFEVAPYGVSPETEVIDYDALQEQVREERPALIIAGASAYPRIIDFERMAEIAHEVGALLMVDMAHIAGLIATGAHPSPFPHADIVTSTTHKTLRGPRSGLILTNNKQLAARIDSAIFPGSQGGPLMHVIAAKAVAFGEALQPAFKTYIDAVVENAAALGEGLVEGGLRLVSGGTDNHLCLVDVTAAGVTGKEAEELLDGVGLTVNKNTIPNETRSPSVASGIRVGSAAGTTRGFNKDDFHAIGKGIAEALFNHDDRAKLERVHDTVNAILKEHPLYPEL